MSHLKNYPSVMYPEKSFSLKTGDVVLLKIDDFKNIVKHDSILDLFKQYNNDLKYKHCLWAILNKACDMVQDKEKNRHFKNNLFLAPLQGLMDVLKEGVLGNSPFVQGNVPSLEQSFIESYKIFLKKNKEPEKSIKSILKKIEGILKEGAEQTQSLDSLLDSLREYSKDSQILTENLIRFRKSEIWLKTVKSFNQEVKKKKKESKINLNSSAIKNKLPKLFLNQMDSSGIFYYEPSTPLSSQGHDLSYIIQLDDMITLKIKEEVQKDGTLSNLLKEKRVISLTENFSDRLLNIMGIFFSKIGTPDVNPSSVIDLYIKSFPNSFVTPSK